MVLARVKRSWSDGGGAMRVGNFLVLVIVTFACTMLLSQVAIAIAQANVRVLVDQETIASLKQADSDRAGEIRVVDQKLTALALSNENRVTRLETDSAQVKAELSSLSTRIWALLLAIFAQLCHVGWTYVKEKKDPTCKGSAFSCPLASKKE